MTIDEMVVRKMVGVVNYWRREAEFHRRFAAYLLVAFAVMGFVCIHQSRTIEQQRMLILQIDKDCPVKP
jgi:hypothetical protein